ncbi:hypothetical protein PTKIN_Ptkin01aG0386000 [Pterospermum kingtungense]
MLLGRYCSWSRHGKIYRADYCDKLGWPVLVMRPGFQNTNSTSGQIRYLVYCMENAIMNMNEDQEQMIWLVDFQRWAMETYFLFDMYVNMYVDFDYVDLISGFDYQAYAQLMKEDDIRKSNSQDSTSILFEPATSESSKLDPDSNASDGNGLSSGDEATPNLDCIDEKIQELQLSCKDVQVDKAAAAKQAQ